MDLNNDTVTEILSHLPARSALRFRSVCKNWRHIIDSSTFTNSHLQNRSKEDDETLFLQFTNIKSLKTCTSQLSILDADSQKSHKGFPTFHKFIDDNIGNCKVWSDLPSIAGPVNGLICMYNRIPYIHSKRSSCFPTAIYNPCLDKIKILPESPAYSSLGLKNWKKRYCFRELGFCFDSVTKDYKVVQLIISLPSGAATVEVYSRKSNTWRKLATDSTLSFISGMRGIKSKSGSSAHWRVERKTGQCILSFDVQNEVFETISYPDFDVRTAEVFVKDDDSLVLFVSSFDCHKMQVWELESGDKERRWNHLRDVDVLPVMDGINPIGPIALWKGDGVVLMERGLTECSLVFYDWSTERVRMWCEIPDLGIAMLLLKGSLISP